MQLYSLAPQLTRQRPVRYALILVVCWWLSACGWGSSTEELQFTGTTMGTTYSVKMIQVPEAVSVDELHTEIEQILDEVNRQMSTYDPDSELSRFNRSAATEWVEVSPDLVEVIEAALQISKLSDGMFDVTVGPLVNLWGFGPELRMAEFPTEEEISQVLSRVGYQHIHTRHSPPALRKEQADIYIDLSAIAKGYGVDKVAEHLESEGIVNYLVEVGGDMRARGRNRRGDPWTIAIEEAIPGKRVVRRLIQIGDQAIATSGDYRNFFEKDGWRYSHALDPRTGRPVEHELVSVTVVDKTAMQADAMATALLVLGAEAGLELARQQKLAVFFIATDSDGFTEQSTSDFNQYLLQ